MSNSSYKNYDTYFILIHSKCETPVLLKKDGLEPDKVTRFGRTALHLAAWGGDTEIAKLLLEDRRIDPYIADKNGHTALELARLNNNTEIVKLLLTHPGIDPNRADDNGFTELHHAASEGDKDTVELLLNDPSIDLNKADDNGFTALHWVTYSKDSSKRAAVTRVLLKKDGLELDAVTYLGQTALHLAASGGDTEIVKLLLEDRRIDLHIADKNGHTALDLAKLNNNAEIVELLLTASRIDPDKDKSPNSLIMVKNNSLLYSPERERGNSQIDENRHEEEREQQPLIDLYG